MQRLTGMDASFLYLETPTAPMHVAGTYVFDPSTAPEGVAWGAARVRQEIARRLHLVPPYRRRLKEVPFQLHHPLWIEDPDFDLDWHVRDVHVNAPGGNKELAELAAEIHGRPLDRSRPLWDMHVVHGLEGGRVAIVARTHHAAIDGASGVDITVNLLDPQPEPGEIEPPAEEWKPDREPTDLELVSDAARSLSQQPISALKAVRRATTAALTLRERNRQPGVTPPPAPFSAPLTPLNGAITARRSFGAAEVELDDVKLVRAALGGTVNDVVLAVCAGALRQYLGEKDALPDRGLVAMCPISVRSEADRSATGNHISSMLVSLATDVDDPVTRLDVIREGTRQAKEQANAIGANTLMDWAELAAPALASTAMGLYSLMKAADWHRPICNTTISNVPGPQLPLYLAGAKLEALYPMGPLNDGAGLNMTVVSYLGTIHFGLVACPDLVPDVDHLAALVPPALEELRKAAEA